MPSPIYADTSSKVSCFPQVRDSDLRRIHPHLKIFKKNLSGFPLSEGVLSRL